MLIGVRLRFMREIVPKGKTTVIDVQLEFQHAEFLTKLLPMRVHLGVTGSLR